MSNDLKRIWNNHDYYISDYGKIAVKRGEGTLIDLKHQLNEKGYHYIKLTFNGKQIKFKIHRLVAACFLGPIPHGYVINHKDTDKSNNNYENLEIVTQSINMKHACMMGCICNKGSKNPAAILNEGKVLRIRKLLNTTDLTYSDIALIYGVSPKTIENIDKRRRWTHI